MSYTNQPDHGLLDRKLIQPVLSLLAQAHVASAPAASSRSEHLDRLLRLAGSELERAWLRFLDARDHRLPTGCAGADRPGGDAARLRLQRPLHRDLRRRPGARCTPTGIAATLT